jgi:hypothetical protein
MPDPAAWAPATNVTTEKIMNRSVLILEDDMGGMIFICVKFKSLTV